MNFSDYLAKLLSSRKRAAKKYLERTERKNLRGWGSSPEFASFKKSERRLRDLFLSVNSDEYTKNIRKVEKPPSRAFYFEDSATDIRGKEIASVLDDDYAFVSEISKEKEIVVVGSASLTREDNTVLRRSFSNKAQLDEVLRLVMRSLENARQAAASNNKPPPFLWTDLETRFAEGKERIYIYYNISFFITVS